MKKLMNSNYVWVWNWFQNFKFILHQYNMILVCMYLFFFYNFNGACYFCLFMSSFSDLTKAAMSNYSPYFIPILNVLNFFESFKIFETQNVGCSILIWRQITLFLNDCVINFNIITLMIIQPIYPGIMLK